MTKKAGCSMAILMMSLAMPVVVQARTEPSDDGSLTLQECYQLALKRSEEIAIHQELIRQTEGQFLQAFSGILPRVSFVSTDKRQDATGDSAFRLRQVPERRFTLSQPLFSGFKEFAAMAGSRAQRRQRRHERRRAEELLLLDVADAFFLLAQSREELETLGVSRAALLEQLDELRARQQLGRSRASESASTEAQLRRVEAETERLKSQEVTATHLLEFLTGLERIGLFAEEPLESEQFSEEHYLDQIARRADVQAAEEAWRVAKQEVTIARSALFPTVDLEGNYYTKRVGASEGVNWDALITVDVPIFQGGKAIGATREARSRARQAELRYQQLTRDAQRQIRDAYALLLAAVAQQQALERALQAAEEDYRLELEDYRVNLISTLDMLQSLQALQETRRDTIAARFETKRRYWQLRVAAGESL